MPKTNPEPPLAFPEGTGEWIGRLLENRAVQRLLKEVETFILYTKASTHWSVEDVLVEIRNRLESRFAEIVDACPEKLHEPDAEEK